MKKTPFENIPISHFELNLIFELRHSFGIWILEFDIGHQPKMLLLPLYLSVSYWV